MSAMTGWMVSAVLVLALAACSDEETSAVQDVTTSNVAASVEGAANAPTTASDDVGNVSANAAVDGAALEGSEPLSAIFGDCYLKIDGKVYLDIKKDCPILLLHDGDGSLILNSDGENEVKTYFAYLTPNGDGTAGASWNEELGARHAQAILSENLKRDGACWFDSRVRICATKR